MKKKSASIKLKAGQCKHLSIEGQIFVHVSATDVDRSKKLKSIMVQVSIPDANSPWELKVESVGNFPDGKKALIIAEK
jgi:hypothetical protein